MTERLSTIDRARGRWTEILPTLGVDRRFLVNRHGPCPLCGGRDRYRFDDREGSGSYFCGQCGAGTGIILIRKLHDWDHATACARVDEIIGSSSPVVSSPAPRGRSSGDARRRVINDLLRESGSQWVVDEYLHRRGIAVSSDVLRGHPRCAYFDENRKFVGQFPAVVAPIHAPDGEVESAHRIYIGNVSPRKKFLPPVRTIKGAAVRLFPAAEGMAIAEGIETALAVQQLTGLSAWAVLDAGNMREFTPPAGISTITIYGDNDTNFVGQAAAYELARKLHAKRITVSVHIPPKQDSDWLDMLTDGVT